MPGASKEDHARFYAASVVLGLEYMQERNLLWRLVDPRLSTAYLLSPCLSKQDHPSRHVKYRHTLLLHVHAATSEEFVSPAGGVHRQLNGSCASALWLCAAGT